MTPPERFREVNRAAGGAHLRQLCLDSPDAKARTEGTAGEGGSSSSHSGEESGYLQLKAEVDQGASLTLTLLADSKLKRQHRGECCLG